ncbi:hypothetical protein [Rhizobium leguminosarum]
MSESISEIRRRAWATRREKYGHLGHNGSYTREPGPCSACDRMRAVLVRLHVEGILSEGQVAKATGMHRIDVRKAGDEYASALSDEPA